MGYRLNPTESMRRETRRVAEERLDRALESFAGLETAEPEQIAEAIHEIRKDCKKLRALAKLARAGLGKHAARLDRAAKEAASELSEFRDNQVALTTFDELMRATGHVDDPRMQQIRTVLDEGTDHTTRIIRGGDARIERAHALLADARTRIDRWKSPKDFSFLASGLGRTYRKGYHLLALADEHPTDSHIHEWRTSVKRLGYQLRLVEMAAPSVLEPLTGRLGVLGELLGDDHDLAMLVERLESDPDRHGSLEDVARAVEIARSRQKELRADAIRLGATVYAEKPDAFVLRVSTYWRIAASFGPEPIAPGRSDEAPVATSAIERERKYLVTEVPPLPDAGTVLRQGYLAIDTNVSVRVRAAGSADYSLTIKGGSGSARAEHEWRLDPGQFEELWELTTPRRVDKTRYEIPFESHIIELDVFAGALQGLVVAEVEFDSAASLDSFTPPAWFGREVTDDRRYTNASLATDGRPPRLDPAADGDSPGGAPTRDVVPWDDAPDRPYGETDPMLEELSMIYEEVVVLAAPFDDALERVKQAFAAEGFGTLTEIDLQATLLAKIGKSMSRYVIIGACNPQLAGRALDVEAQIGVLLPCNVAVRETEDGIMVEAMDPGLMATITGNDDMAAIAADARRLVGNALNRLQSGESS